MPEEEKPCELHAFQLEQHQERLNKLDEILEKVRNRLPIWATLLLSALLAVIGYLISFARAVK
jgi:cell division protein FtsB